MKKNKHCFTIKRDKRSAVLCMALCVAASTQTASAFTQSGAGTDIANGIPMGHEWITRLAALELLIPGRDPIMPPDPNDPRNKWSQQGKAKNTDISSQAAQTEVSRIQKYPYSDTRYQSTYKFIYDTIVGERWVDIAGFNVTNGKIPVPGNVDCFDAVAQEPVEVQYDHFMRRYDDRGGNGGVQAVQRSRDRFIEYFVAAATAPKMAMKVWDGGGYSAITEVDRNYFLFGRAVHLFEDSFSSEHTVRTAEDNFERIRQVKSYLCAAGSEQHTHSNDEIFNYQSGDVIWKAGTGLNPGWPAYKPSNMKTVTLVSTEATKDLWAAFIRTMGVAPDQRAQVARDEATRLADNWLHADQKEVLDYYNDPLHRDATYVLESGQSGSGQTVEKCMQKLGVPSGNQMVKVRELEKNQRMCLYNILPEDGYADLYDTSVHMPFNWKWKNAVAWQQPPENWTIPNRPADTGVQVKIKSASNNQYSVAPDGIKDNQWLYCKANYAPVNFVQVPAENGSFFRSTDNSSLFLSYNATTGAVKFWASPSQANYQLERAGNNNIAIKNLYWNQYMWLSGESPYITRTGNPSNLNSQWIIEANHP
jgi:predicted small secreted protein